MEKLPPPPRLADRSDIDAVLRSLYRRRMVVRRLIRSLESYAQMNRVPQGAGTLITAPPASQQVH
jgi:hypothetical protein